MYLLRVTNSHEHRVDRAGHAFEAGETREIAVEPYYRLEVEACAYFTVEVLDENYTPPEEGNGEGVHPEVRVQPATDSGDEAAASTDSGDEHLSGGGEAEGEGATSEVEGDANENEAKAKNDDVSELSADEVEAQRKNQE